MHFPCTPCKHAGLLPQLLVPVMLLIVVSFSVVILVGVTPSPHPVCHVLLLRINHDGLMCSKYSFRGNLKFDLLMRSVFNAKFVSFEMRFEREVLCRVVAPPNDQCVFFWPDWKPVARARPVGLVGVEARGRVPSIHKHTAEVKAR